MTPRNITLDASVLVAATLPDEPGHRNAATLMARLSVDESNISAPAILLPEFAGALRRNGRPPARIHEYLRIFKSDRTQIWPVDFVLAGIGAEIALLHGLKGADALYLALARLLAIPLITLDREQRERAPADVEVFAPEEALARWWPE